MMEDTNSGFDKITAYSSYCNKCEFSSWCNKKNKTFLLQTTIEAKDLFISMRKKTFAFDYLELPYKTYQLANILENVVNNYTPPK